MINLARPTTVKSMEDSFKKIAEDLITSISFDDASLSKEDILGSLYDLTLNRSASRATNSNFTVKDSSLNLNPYKSHQHLLS